MAWLYDIAECLYRKRGDDAGDKRNKIMWMFPSLLHTLCLPKQISFLSPFIVCDHQLLCAFRVVFHHICHDHQLSKESHAWQPEIPMIQVPSYRFRYFLLLPFTCVCYLSQFNCLVLCCHQGLVSLCHISSENPCLDSFHQIILSLAATTTTTKTLSKLFWSYNVNLSQ